jgi:hypothetical protein
MTQQIPLNYSDFKICPATPRDIKCNMEGVVAAAAEIGNPGTFGGT